MTIDYVFTPCKVNDVILNPIAAFPAPGCFDGWYTYLINCFLPELGEEYMILFIRCKFNPYYFFKILEERGELKEIKNDILP